MLISEREIRKKEKSIPKANAGMLLAAEALKPKQKSKEELAHELELAKMKEARKKERREGRKKFFGKVGKGIKNTGKWLMSDEPVFQTVDGIKLTPDEKKMIRNAYFTNNDVSVAMRYVEPKLKPSKYDLARDYMNSLFKSGGEITPKLNSEVIKRAEKIYSEENGKSKADFDEAYDKSIIEFGYEPSYFKKIMNEIGEEYDDSEYAEGGKIKSKKNKICCSCKNNLFCINTDKDLFEFWSKPENANKTIFFVEEMEDEEENSYHYVVGSQTKEFYNDNRYWDFDGIYHSVGDAEKSAIKKAKQTENGIYVNNLPITRGYAQGGEVNDNISEFQNKIKDLLKQENKWHFINEEVDGKQVKMKFFVGKKEVDVQIFTIDNLGARLPRNYSGKRDTLQMIMDNFRKFEDGGEIEGVDLFEDYENIPENVQEILDAYEHGFVDGDYDSLTKAHEELEKIGYTFDFYLDGQAYDLRKIGQKGKTALAVEEQEKEGKDEYDFKFVGEKIVKEFEYLNLKIKIAEYRNKYYGISNYGEPLVDSPKLYSTPEQAEKKIKETVEDFLSDETEEVFGRGDVVEESAVINLEGEDKNEQEIYYENIHVPMNWALKSDSDLLNYLVVRNKISKKDYFALMKSGNYEIERMEMGGEIKTGCAFSTLFHCPVK